MSFETGFLLCAVAVAAAMTVSVLRALRRGVWGARELEFRRDDQPSEYWFSLAWSALAALMFLYYGFAIHSGVRADELVWLNFVLPAGPAIFWLVRSLRTRAVGLGNLQFGREDEPREYWALVIFNLLIIAFLVSWLFRVW
jgi:hypothetical protein